MQAWERTGNFSDYMNIEFLAIEFFLELFLCFIEIKFTILVASLI